MIKFVWVVLREILHVVLVDILIHCDVVGAFCVSLEQDMPPERVIIFYLDHVWLLVLFLLGLEASLKWFQMVLAVEFMVFSRFIHQDSSDLLLNLTVFMQVTC